MLKNLFLAFNRGEHCDLLRRNRILRRMDIRSAQWWASTFTVQIFLPVVFNMEKLSFSSLETTFL